MEQDNGAGRAAFSWNSRYIFQSSTPPPIQITHSTAHHAKKKNPTMRSLFLFPIIWHLALAASVRSIFLFKDVMKSNTTALKTSGFNTLIMFGVGILSNGDIMYYSNTPESQDVRIASGGVYVGGDALAQKVRSLKTGETGVTRLEISMNAQNVRNLIMTPGPGPETPLFRNFQALKEAWTLDAVNNDDESIYDLNSSVAFGRMLGQIGYKYTIAPYTNAQFWLNVKNQLNQGLKEQDRLLDRVYLQCYDGGAYNNPPGWQTFLGMKVVPLIWVINDSKPVYGATAAQARTRLTQWHQQSTLAGGGYWNDYDIEKMGLSYRDYGNVLASIFP
ncbi:hypothetical protein QC764_611130 [Podospora pseudoanserina]|uniref:Coagulation factor 5/8 type domain-containing protein n=1 Tax=Podospora pseudoanserina TaxID=2609844 RepID=A0ABR0HW06_9PEZI|nr:hypothetical protein QC764_611130 [Podospora pseudoanserina]